MVQFLSNELKIVRSLQYYYVDWKHQHILHSKILGFAKWILLFHLAQFGAIPIVNFTSPMSFLIASIHAHLDLLLALLAPWNTIITFPSCDHKGLPCICPTILIGYLSFYPQSDNFYLLVNALFFCFTS